MEAERLLLSRYKLETFWVCQRRFQLRYISRLKWPTMPVPSGLEEAFFQGELFHRLLEQFSLGLVVELPQDASADIQQWWRTFQSDPPVFPAGKRYPELSLSVPVGKHFLFGRFDLLILNENEAHIFDWKTERTPRSFEKLRDDWQTRLYFTMVLEGCRALGYQYKPEQIKMSYWFARAPEKSVTIGYDEAQHRENWATLLAMVERLDQRLETPDAVWPLTDDWSNCRECGYRGYCGRWGDSAEFPPLPTLLSSMIEEESLIIELEPPAPGEVGEE